ncbi:MAG: anti-sigma regulatory factor [Marinisporobacter sp.]|jgi:serine/threonine-protein kinase RsbT|nr:anti-sigma regulatory factor [Marinisporobacter sp.]
MDKLEGEFTLFQGKNVNILESVLVKLVEDYDNGHVIFIAREMSVKAGFMSTDEVMIATAASELSTNIIRYAKKGEMIISIIKNLKDGRKGLEIYASDNGPGIRDIELAMQEQYSSLPNSLGLGLPSVKRIMDEFYMESLMGRGTRVLVRRWMK